MGARTSGKPPAANPGTRAQLARAAAALGCLAAVVLSWAQQTASAQPGSAKPSPVSGAERGPRLKRVLVDGRDVGRGPDMKRFRIKIDPRTPLAELLPEPPAGALVAAPPLPDDLARVPEVSFAAPYPRGLKPEQALERIARQVAGINHVNKAKADAFMEALLKSRPDLAGLPAVTGDACRQSDRQADFFRSVVTALRANLDPPLGSWARRSDREAAEAFWRSVGRVRLSDWSHEERSPLVTALEQVLSVEPAPFRQGLARYLESAEGIEAAPALARLAIFSPEAEVRLTALLALKGRPAPDYADVLRSGLRYPWPAVARSAAEVAAWLGRTDLGPELVGMLEGPDPRLPTHKREGGKDVWQVRELVRINHHRNCLLCHAPATPDDSDKVASGVPRDDGPLLAPVPTPGAFLPSSGYEFSPFSSPFSSPDAAVRVDVTYLRQDFSLLMKVPDAAPWPEMQRFDFLVRTRTLTDDEARGYRAEAERRAAAGDSPYRDAALAALRRLTGRDAGTAAADWRRLLGLPEPSPASRPE